MQLRRIRGVSRMGVGVAAGLAVGVAVLSIGISAPPASASLFPPPKPPPKPKPMRIITSTVDVPAGALYLLAGKNATSCNVWVVTANGRQIRLTKERKRNFGLDSMSASTEGIVVSKVEKHGDRTERVTSKGLSALPGGIGSHPFVTSDGKVYLVTRHAGRYRIAVAKNFTSNPTVIYSQRPVIGVVQAGDGGLVSFISNPHPIGPGGPVELRIYEGAHHAIQQLYTGLGNPSNVTWSTNAAGLAVDSNRGPGLVFLVQGASQRGIPKHWDSLSWSPDGTELLLRQGNKIGLWSPIVGGGVKVIATAVKGEKIFHAVWLSQAAKL